MSLWFSISEQFVCNKLDGPHFLLGHWAVLFTISVIQLDTTDRAAWFDIPPVLPITVTVMWDVMTRSLVDSYSSWCQSMSLVSPPDISDENIGPGNTNPLLSCAKQCLRLTFAGVVVTACYLPLCPSACLHPLARFVPATWWTCCFHLQGRRESWKWRHGIEPKHSYLSLRLQGISTQKTVILMVAGRMLTLTCHVLLWNVTTMVPCMSSWNGARHEMNIAFPALATYWEQKTTCRLAFCGSQASL